MMIIKCEKCSGSKDVICKKCHEDELNQMQIQIDFALDRIEELEKYKEENKDVLRKNELNSSNEDLQGKSTAQLAKDIIKTIRVRENRSNIGTLTRIYSYCRKQINIQQSQQQRSNSGSSCEMERGELGSTETGGIISVGVEVHCYLKGC